MTPAVVVTDLDGTLVRRDGTISDRTKAALASAGDAGALVIVATGRPPRWMLGIADAVGHRGLAICANGAIVFDLATQEVVEARPLDEEVARGLAHQLRDAVPGITFAVERVGGSFAHETDYRPRWTPPSETEIGDLDGLLTAPVSKLLARREGMSSDDLLAIGRATIDQSVATLTHSSIDGLLEISAYGVTKATTLAALIESRGHRAEDVLAFGDMPNDVEMLRWAGHGVAVANAHPELLAVADEVTASNDDDGVAKVLERFFR
jgi:hypothetical protein